MLTRRFLSSSLIELWASLISHGLSLNHKLKANSKVLVLRIVLYRPPLKGGQDGSLHIGAYSFVPLKGYTQHHDGKSSMNNNRGQEHIPNIAVPLEETFEPVVFSKSGSQSPGIDAAAG